MLEARSIAEARAYIQHEPCARCGSRGFDAASSIVERGERLGVVARGYCTRCGDDRAFELLLAEERVPPGKLGNDNPSHLIDAGGWFDIANAHAERVPGSASGLTPEARRAAAQDLRMALAALDEIHKFIPATADAVPRTGFFTAAGKRAVLADPRQFTRLRLGAIDEAWRRLVVEFES